MTSAREPAKSHTVSFRAKLLVAMMLLVSALTATGLYLAEHNATKEVERDFQRDFHSELAAMHRVEEVRYAALAERCRVLMKNPRLHAALEDNALDLLYPSARDELRDVMAKDPALNGRNSRRAVSTQGSIASWIERGRLAPAQRGRCRRLAAARGGTARTEASSLNPANWLPLENGRPLKMNGSTRSLPFR